MDVSTAPVVLAVSALVSSLSFAGLLGALTFVVKRRAESIERLEVGKSGTRFQVVVEMSKDNSGQRTKKGKRKRRA